MAVYLHAWTTSNTGLLRQLIVITHMLTACLYSVYRGVLKGAAAITLQPS